MISIKFDDKQFFKELMNITEYSKGFLEGVKNGEPVFLKQLGRDAIEIFKQFVDQNARVDPQTYHHIYEWYHEGSPEARLYDIEYTVVGNGLSFNGVFTQSKTVQNGSHTPFYNKAEIMEKGIPVTIKPVISSVLTFTDNGEKIFTPNPVDVQNPGGTHVVGSFEHIFDLFFKEHFSQSVLHMTGIAKHLGNIKTYKDNLSGGKNNGKEFGKRIGYNWIVNAGGLDV